MNKEELAISILNYFREIIQDNNKVYYDLKKWLNEQELDIEYVLYEDEEGNKVLKEYLKKVLR